MLSNSDSVTVADKEGQNTVMEAMKNNNSLIFKIYEKDGMDEYLFTVNCTGFADMINSLDYVSS